MNKVGAQLKTSGERPRMTSRANQIILKEDLSTYRRWEMDVLEQGAVLEGPADTSVDTKDEAMPEQIQVALPTVEEIEKIHQEARQEGYDAGYETGREAGMKAGYDAGRERASFEAGQLTAAFGGLQEALASADQKICNALLSLALDVAKEMVREALRVKPELVFAVVRECIQSEPVLGQPAQLFLHPDDAVLVRAHLNQELDHCVINPDPRLERGGCRVRVGPSDIDATVSTRWQRITQSLGQHNDWLERH
ncbi:MAG: flagellar assembly protein FliH [Nitrosomonadales bacterium SCN 54-20]|nr:MAG: flagellar assembly protein FliH [Nitrosomonadales bacterium SCN 54-20]